MEYEYRLLPFVEWRVDHVTRDPAPGLVLAFIYFLIIHTVIKNDCTDNNDPKYLGRGTAELMLGDVSTNKVT